MSLTERLEHSGSAGPTTLSADITAGATSITGDDYTGYPTGSVGKFVITIGRGTPDEERILCTTRTGNTITVDTRGWDGSVARTHSQGAVIEHTWSQTEADQANAHTSSTSEHGVTGDVVGTGGTQTLTGKTLVAPTITDFSNAAHDHGDADDGGSIAHSVLTGLTTGDPHTQYQLESEKGQANGYASLDGSTLLPTAQLPSIPYAKLPVGSAAGSTVADGGHTHTVDAPTNDLTITQWTLSDADPARTMAEVDLGVGTWLILATCAGCTLGASTATRWQYDLTSTGGTATFIGAAPVAQQSDGTGLQGGGTVWGLLTVTAGTVNVAFTIEKLGSGAQVTNSAIGALMALPLHGI